MPKGLWKWFFSSSLLQPVPVPLYKSRMPRYKNNTPSAAFSQSEVERFIYLYLPPGGSIRAVLPGFIGHQVKNIYHNSDQQPAAAPRSLGQEDVQERNDGVKDK